jgi:chemotaxis protein CheC
MYDEMDILKEVGSIAAAHGGIALSEILGRKISLEVPSVDVVACTEVCRRVTTGKLGVAVFTKITELDGELAFILDEKSAFKLVDLSYKIMPDDKRSGVLTELGMSFIKEVGNMIIGYYISALSVMLKSLILPMIPTLISGPLDQIMDTILSCHGEEEYAVLMEAVFEEPSEHIKGSFYLLLTPKAAANIQDCCKKMLKDLEDKH